MVTDAVDEFYNRQINSWWPRLGPSLVLESREEATTAICQPTNR